MSKSCVPTHSELVRIVKEWAYDIAEFYTVDIEAKEIQCLATLLGNYLEEFEKKVTKEVSNEAYNMGFDHGLISAGWARNS